MNTKKPAKQQTIRELEMKLEKSSTDLTSCMKEKEEFIYIAAHELKAPLRKITTFSERLKEKSQQLSDESLLYLERIEKNIACMQSMINGLSKLAEIEPENFEKVDLNLLIQQIIENDAAVIEEKKAEITIAELPVVEGNAFQLKEVFKNLINNSLKFQPESQTPKITIQSQLLSEDEKIKFNFDAGKVFYEIKITDNGIGFRGENAGKIFQPFIRLNGKSEFPGEGLGLAISKKIIKMHNGVLYANAAEDSGSFFVIIIPQIQ